jgi:hypothetical protein
VEGCGEERAAAVAAIYLSRPLVRKRPRSARAWNQGQWKSILRHAARLSGKKFEASELERWVWWCYPVFCAYRWNSRQVLEAASVRGIDFSREKAGLDEIVRFQRYWIRRGLRCAGGKQELKATPPLWEFVISVVLPETDKMWGSAGGVLFSSEK